MKAGSREPEQEPGREWESVQREARTCPVCGTKYFATADREFRPVCILRGATSGASAAIEVPGSVSGSEAALRKLTVGPAIAGAIFR
jgi:rubredoxin